MGNQKLFFVKIAHSIIFIFMLLCLFYILYCAITRTYDWTLLVALGAILLEGLALLLNRWQCPLTTLARNFGDDRGNVTDIFLPAWLATRTFQIFSVVFAVELVLLSLGYFL